MYRLRNLLFKNTTVRQTIAKNTFWLFIAETGVRLFKLGVFVYAARILSIQEWGAFAYVIALMATFAVISDIGINAVLIKAVAKRDTREYISTSFVLKVILSFIASILFLVSGLSLHTLNGIAALIPLTALILFIDSMREFGFAINRAHEKMEWEAGSKILTALLLFLFSVLFLSYDTSALALVYAYLASSCIGFIVTFSGIRSYLTDLYSKFDKTLLGPIFNQAFPLALAGVFGILLTNIDTIILGWFKNATQVGIYAAAQKPVQLLYLMPAIMSTVLLPILSRHADNQDTFRAIIKKTIRISLAVTIPLAVIAIFTSAPLITLLFGQTYAQASTIFAILSVAIVVGAPGAIMGSVLFAKGMQKKTMRALFIGLLSNLVLCFTLIPRWGIYGAAISATVSQVVVNLILIITVTHAIKFSQK